MNDFDIDGAQAAIGYKFKNKELLVSALTHKSYANEHVAIANERLEFLGDCALNFLVGLELYERNGAADEGTLSARRAACVSRTPLAGLVKKLDLMKFLRVGAGVNKSEFSEKARSNLYEAVLGAIYLDGGLDACKGFLDKTFFPNVEPKRDYKTELQNLVVSRGGTAPTYAILPIDGGFRAELTALGQSFSGDGKTKHGAEIAAAKIAVAALSDKKG